MGLSTNILIRAVLPFAPLLGPFGYLAPFLHLNLTRLRFSQFSFQVLSFSGILFLILYLIYENPIFLRTYGLLCGVCFAKLYVKNSKTASLDSLLKTFFWINIFFIVLEVCAYQFGQNIFGSKGRFGGLLGYDFVPFIMCTYLVYLLGCNRRVSFVDGISIVLAVVTTLFSGRFGIPLLGIAALYILVQRRNFTVLASVIISAFLLFLVFDSQVKFTFSTIAVLLEGSKAQAGDFSILADYGVEGYYNASPLNWLHEFLSVFNSYSTIFFPSKQSIFVDSGPAFLVANGSVFLMLFYYATTLLFLPPSDQRRGFILCILFITDLKFRCLLSALPTLWLLIMFEVIKRDDGRPAAISLKGTCNGEIYDSSHNRRSLT